MNDQELYGGDAIKAMLSEVEVDSQLKSLKKEVVNTKSPSKRDTMIKKVKFLDGLKRLGARPEDVFILHNMPVVPPIVRPSIPMGGNRIEYADVNNLYKDHMLVNKTLGEVINITPDDRLTEGRRDLYRGAKAVFGVGEAIGGNSRGKQLKGFIKQISGDTGPKGGFFHSKLLSKKQDFSGRATIYAESNLGFNEMAVPKDMLWAMYKFHVIRDLVKNGYSYVDAKKAVEEKSQSAIASFSKLVKQIPMLANRAPTLMKTNIIAAYPVPIEGRSVGMNPLHLPFFAADIDGDAMTYHVPMTPEAIEEAKKKLLPATQIYDYRKGLNHSMVQPGHEAIIGSMHITEPDVTQKPVVFKSEEEALSALKHGTILENTPITILDHSK